MNEIDILAQQFHSYGDRSLADYFVAMLPCQILHMDTLIVEKRPLPTPTEFVLKAIKAGLNSQENIAKFLGLTQEYTDKLLTGLKLDDYIGFDEFGKLKLFRRALEALASDGERRSLDKTVSILWDPILATPIQQRIDLYTQNTAKQAGKIWELQRVFHAPDINSLNNGDIQNYLNSKQTPTNDREIYEILRIIAIKKTLIRFRQVTVLVYEKESSHPIFKIAYNGKIDDKLSDAIAQKDGAKLIGLDTSFSRKAGALAVNERYKKLPVLHTTEEQKKLDIATLARQRSILMFAIDALNNRISEEPSETLKTKLLTKEAEYADIEGVLKEVEIVPILPFDVPLALSSALESDGNVLSITTTTPNENHFTVSIQRQMKKALAGGMKINIYIAGRLEHDHNINNNKGHALAALNQIANEYSNLQVFFLKNQNRQVFEIYLEKSTLVFCNASPLGNRPEPFSPRAFRGFRISGKSQIDAYVKSHLSFSQDDLIKQIRNQKPNKKQASTNRK